tara:strand:- start:1675 stop:2916 length:1242 start_codon:yes stop_codon:yes gene_type:complete
LHLASIAATARILDLEEFGLLMLFRSVAQGIAAIAKFQSWQALVHFGADAYERGENSEVARLWLKLALIDGIVGVLALLLGGVFVFSLSELVDIPPTMAPLAALYCLAIPLQVAGTPTGILRLTDRFDLMAWQSLITPSVRLIGVCVAYLLGAPLWSIVLAWVVSEVAGDGFLWLCALLVARERRLLPHSTMKGGGGIARAGLWQYLVGTNFNATLQQGSLPLITLVVGSTLGAPSAGAFRLAQTVLDAVVAPVDLAMRSLFPEISKLRTAKGDRLYRIMRHVALTSLILSVPLSVILYAGASVFVTLLAGPEYANAGIMLGILAWTAPALFLAATCETFMLGSGRALPAVLSRVTSIGLALTFMLILGDRLGLSGLGVVFLVASYSGLLVLSVPTALTMHRSRLSQPPKLRK